MAHAGTAQGILEGQMESDIDDKEMKQKICDIFNRIMDGYKMVNDADVELCNIIDHSLLQILGKILSDVYMSATAKTMQKEKDDDDNDDYSDDDEEKEETIIIQKIKWAPGASTSLTPVMTPTQTKTKTLAQTKTKTPTQTKMRTPPRQQTKTATKTDMDTDKDMAPGKAKSKGSKSKAAVKRVGPEGLLEPLHYNDDQGARHYSCPYGGSEDLVNYTSIEGMRGHIRRVHGRGGGVPL